MSEPRLIVSDLQGRRVVAIDKPVFSIGRRSSADLQIVSTDISRAHAEISHEGGRFILRDCGSRYGTYVDGEAVRERLLTHGARIRLGRAEGVELMFAIDDTPATGFGDSTSDAADLRQMAAILNGLRAVGSGRVLEEVLTLVIDSALDVTKAERGFIMLASAGRELEFKAARGRNRVALPGTSFATSAKIPREVFETGESRIVADLLDGAFTGAHDGTIAVGIRHVLCVPLRVAAYGPAQTEPRVIGVLYLDGRERGTMLSPATRASLEAFATQAALAIDSARLYAEAAEKARIEHDLRVAAEIQQALLPQPSFAGEAADLAAVSVPCRTIGGDFFDYVELPGGGLGFALGDVAGKGPPAALLAATVQSHFVAHAQMGLDPADTMARINKALLRRAIEARFATMFYGVVSTSGELRYCNAGQEPPILVQRGRISRLEAGGPVLGLLRDARYEWEALTLEPGDLIVVCSDGLTEATNPEGVELGSGPLIEAARTRHGCEPGVVLEAVLSAVRAFAAGAAQGDDITALVLRYRGRR